jgi:hypothetical protein
VSRWSRRVARIKKARLEGVTGFRLRDGRVRYIRDSYAAFLEACDGIDTPRARVLLTAVNCVTSGGGRLHELAQSIVGDGPALERPIAQPMEPIQ